MASTGAEDATGHPLLEEGVDGVDGCTAVMETTGEGAGRRAEREGGTLQGKSGTEARKAVGTGMLDVGSCDCCVRVWRLLGLGSSTGNGQEWLSNDADWKGQGDVVVCAEERVPRQRLEVTGGAIGDVGDVCWGCGRLFVCVDDVDVQRLAREGFSGMRGIYARLIRAMRSCAVRLKANRRGLRRCASSIDHRMHAFLLGLFSGTSIALIGRDLVNGQ